MMINVDCLKYCCTALIGTEYTNNWKSRHVYVIVGIL